MTYSGCPEFFLRNLIQAGKLRHFRISPKSQILVRPSWFDEYVDRETQKVPKASTRKKRILKERARRIVEELLA
ncbi:hypothetical protein MYX82_11545 [Acidobacteria bacterium AH-259-D05]|nr:hypothetical protein [Acidobacteria bacterium AH-259-D05]